MFSCLYMHPFACLSTNLYSLDFFRSCSMPGSRVSGGYSMVACLHRNLSQLWFLLQKPDLPSVMSGTRFQPRRSSSG